MLPYEKKMLYEESYNGISMSTIKKDTEYITVSVLFTCQYFIHSFPCMVSAVSYFHKLTAKNEEEQNHLVSR